MRVILYLPGSTNNVKALDADYIPVRVALRVCRDIRTVHEVPGAILDCHNEAGELLFSQTCTPRGWLRMD